MMACCLLSTKPLSGLLLAYCELDPPPWAQNYVNFKSEYNNLHEPTDNLEYNHNEPKEDKTMSIF